MPRRTYGITCRVQRRARSSWQRPGRRTAARADRLAETHDALAGAIDRWRADGDLGAFPPPPEVTLWALHQQRIHLLLTSRPALAQRVLERLPAKPAAHLRATFVARRGLRKITPPTPGRYRTGPPEPPRTLLAHYRKAQRRFGGQWPPLAAGELRAAALPPPRQPRPPGA